MPKYRCQHSGVELNTENKNASSEVLMKDAVEKGYCDGYRKGFADGYLESLEKCEQYLNNNLKLI